MNLMQMMSMSLAIALDRIGSVMYTSYLDGYQAFHWVNHAALLD